MVSPVAGVAGAGFGAGGAASASINSAASVTVTTVVAEAADTVSDARPSFDLRGEPLKAVATARSGWVMTAAVDTLNARCAGYLGSLLPPS